MLCLSGWAVLEVSSAFTWFRLGSIVSRTVLITESLERLLRFNLGFGQLRHFGVGGFGPRILHLEPETRKSKALAARSKLFNRLE